MIWSYRVKGAGLVSQLLSRNPKDLLVACLLCETNHASLTNQCLTTAVMCTVPDPSSRPSHLYHLSSPRPAIGQSGYINPLDSVTLYRVQYNVGCNQTKDPKSRYSKQGSKREIISYKASTDSPRRKADGYQISCVGLRRAEYGPE